MQTSVSPLDNLKRRLRINLSSEETEDLLNSKAREIASKARIPGFRPGRVPISLIRDRYHTELLVEIRKESVQSKFNEAVSTENLNVFSVLEIDERFHSDDGHLEYVLDVIEAPKLNLDQLQQLNILKPVVRVRDEDIQTAVRMLERNIGTTEKVVREINDKDHIRVEVKDLGTQMRQAGGVVNSNLPEDYQGERLIYMNELGYSRFSIAQHIQNGLLAKKVGDKFIVEKEFEPGSETGFEALVLVEDRKLPGTNTAEDEHASTQEDAEADMLKEAQVPRIATESLQNFAKLHFEVEIKEILEPTLGDLTQEYFDDNTVPGVESLEDFKDKARLNYEADAQEKAEKVVASQLIAQLAEMNPVDFSEEFLRNQIDQEFSQYADSERLRQEEDFESKLYSDTAFRNVRMNMLSQLIIQQYLRDNEIQLDRAEFDKELAGLHQSILQHGGDPETVFKPETTNRIRSRVLSNQAIEHMQSKVHLVEMELSYFDFVELFSQEFWQEIKPRGGPYEWTAPVTPEEIEAAVSEEERLQRQWTGESEEVDAGDFAEIGSQESEVLVDEKEKQSTWIGKFMRKHFGLKND